MTGASGAGERAGTLYYRGYRLIRLTPDGKAHIQPARERTTACGIRPGPGAFGPVLFPVRAPDLHTWSDWYSGTDEVRRLALTKVGEAEVSTVFLGMDHSFGEGPPVLWETMVFWSGHELDGEMDRYRSREAAEQGHAAMVRRVEEAQRGK